MADPTILGIHVLDIILFIGEIILTIAMARLTYGLVRKALDLNVGKKRSKITASFFQYIVLSIGVAYGVLYVLELDMAALAASLGIAGIALAFSSQQVIQNFVAGLMVSLEHRVQLEDWVGMADIPTNQPARVVELTLTKTILRDTSGNLIIVPNNLLVTSMVVNYTQAGFVRVDIPFPLPIGADRKQVEKIINDVIDEHPKVLPNVQKEEEGAILSILRLPKIKRLFDNKLNMDQFKPQVLLLEVTTLRTILNVRIWIREVQYRDRIVSEILTKVLDELERQDIKPN